MFINATTRQQISIYSIAPYWYLLACTPHLEMWGYKNFSASVYPHLKIRGAAHADTITTTTTTFGFCLGGQVSHCLASDLQIWGPWLFLSLSCRQPCTVSQLPQYADPLPLKFDNYNHGTTIYMPLSYYAPAEGPNNKTRCLTSDVCLSDVCLSVAYMKR